MSGTRHQGAANLAIVTNSVQIFFCFSLIFGFKVYFQATLQGEGRVAVKSGANE